MTQHRIKKKDRLRFCRVRLAPECEEIFKTENKRSRFAACDHCKTHLWNHGINIEGYLKMRQELKEEVVWKNKDNATMVVSTKNPVMVNGKQKGTTETTANMDVTYDDIVKGREVLIDRIAKTTGKLTELEGQQSRLGKVPSKTSEMIRLEKNLQALGLIQQNKKIENQVGPLKEDLIEQEHNLKQREKCLNTRPSECVKKIYNKFV